MKKSFLLVGFDCDKCSAYIDVTLLSQFVLGYRLIVDSKVIKLYNGSNFIRIYIEDRHFRMPDSFYQLDINKSLIEQFNEMIKKAPKFAAFI